MSGMLIFVLVLVAALIITLYMVYKNGGSSPAPAPASAPAPSGPSIDVQGIERTLNPDKSDNGSSSTSGYAIREYSTGTDNFDYNKLTENVEITLKWDNQGGFDSVTGLIAEWQIKGEGDNDYVTRMTKTLNKTDYPDAFSNYTRGNTVTFTGNKDLADDKRFSAVGENIIHLYYNTTEVTKQQITPDVDAINYTPWVIGVSDLSATIDMVDPKTYTYVPIKSDVSLGRDQTHTDYKIYSKLFKDDISKLIISNDIHERNNYRLENKPGYIRLTPVVVNGTVQKDKIKLVYVSEDGTVKKGVGVAGKTPGIEKVINPRLTNSDFYDDASEKYATDQPYIGVTDNIDDSYIFNIVPVYKSDGRTIEYYRFQDSVETDRFMCLRKVVYDAKKSRVEVIEGVDRYATVQVCLKNANELSFCEKESMDFTLVEKGGTAPPYTSAAKSKTGITDPPAGECEQYARLKNVNYNWRCQNRIVISQEDGNKERHREVVPIHNGCNVSN